jgi:hypothetical protein
MISAWSPLLSRVTIGIFLAAAYDSFRGSFYTGKKRRIQVNGMLRHKSESSY